MPQPRRPRATKPLLAAAAAGIARLNQRHGPGLGGDRFLLLHRRRVWNKGEGRWLGWERKRGKLHELNQLLRGATDTTFLGLNGLPPAVPADVRYVVTLDADTRLPRDTARRLIGKMAHPLNRPRFDVAAGRVVEGHAVIQPRVTPSLPVGREGSLFQRTFSSMSGIDPYASAVSDVYQDLFDEAREFLLEGNKVRVTCMFRGREMLHMDLGEKVLKLMFTQLEDVAVIEAPIKVMGRFMSVGYAPKGKK